MINISQTILVIILIGFLSVYSQNEAQETFADYLFNQGEYYRAVTEYYRMLHHTADSAQKMDLYRKIGRCYIEGEDYEGYISFYRNNLKIFQEDFLIFTELSLNLSKSYYHLTLYNNAVKNLKSNDVNSGNPYFNDCQFLIGISYAQMSEWEKAVQQLERVIDVPRQSDRKTAENLIRSFKNHPSLPQKNPLLAGGLSAVIPGSGYAYCEHWGTGIASLAVNGLIGWAFIDALNKDQYGIASLTGFLGIGWYIGNIKGSVNAARRYNSQIQSAYINRVLQRENLLEYVQPEN
jgi:tetratricopeptide (TPR) repeat protein